MGLGGDGIVPKAGYASPMLPAHPPERRLVTPEPLNVSPGLVGTPLATPARRAWAMAIDLALVALLSSLNDLWLAGGLLLVVLQLRSQTAGEGWRRIVGWALVMLFVLLALRAGWLAWHAPPAPKEPAEAEERAVQAAAKVGAGLPAAERVPLLEAALESAIQERAKKPTSVGEELERLLDGVGASFGWGIVYFSLLPAFWSGQTIGKRLFGLKVVELTGKPMTVMRCLKRYGGYAAGMATGGLGFTQLLWDPNRQAIQDRTAHTVVIDLRAPAAPSTTD